MPPVRVECPRIGVHGLGRSNHATCAVPYRHRSYPHRYLMPGLVPQRNFCDRWPPVPQYAGQRPAQLANSVLARFPLRRKKIPAKMSHHVLP
jgi:hypothetical protein